MGLAATVSPSLKDHLIADKYWYSVTFLISGGILHHPYELGISSNVECLGKHLV